MNWQGFKGGLGAVLIGSAIALTATAVAADPGARASTGGRPGGTHHQSRHISHVLLISVDGLHQSDLRWYVRKHPHSVLAKLARRGLEYTHARTPVPSDSFPGMLAQVTGGNPRTTGVYYDAEYSHAVLAPGASCTPGGANGPLGGPVHYDESIDRNPLSIDAGQGLSGLPDSILSMTANPRTVINPTALRQDPSSCHRIYPHEYLKVNTVFEVAKQHGMRTAWSDKHPAYDILNGPSGNGIDDLFTPEINSNAFHSNGTPYGGDWTKDNAATRQYDSYKVKAVLNELAGYDHSGSKKVGVPALLGMNFQTISTAQKLPQSEATIGGSQLPGGYLPGTKTPGPLLSSALDYLNGKLEAMAQKLKGKGLGKSTAIILSAKHGQSPQDPLALTRIDDGPIIDAINQAWRAEIHNPSAPDLVADSTNDDAIMMWLSDRSTKATSFVARWLMTHQATGNTYNATNPTQPGPPRTLQSSGLVKVYAGSSAARYFGVPANDPRHPDVWGIVQHGVVYTGGTGKIAEHGGANPEDRDVPLVLYVPRAHHPRKVGGSVETTQIAPTILRLLGLDPSQLRAVREEGTEALAGLGRR